MSFNEDASRIRKGDAAENFSRLRRIALALLKRETTEKVGIKNNRLRAGWETIGQLRRLGLPLPPGVESLLGLHIPPES